MTIEQINAKYVTTDYSIEHINSVSSAFIDLYVNNVSPKRDFFDCIQLDKKAYTETMHVCFDAILKLHYVEQNNGNDFQQYRNIAIRAIGNVYKTLHLPHIMPCFSDYLVLSSNISETKCRNSAKTEDGIKTQVVKKSFGDITIAKFSNNFRFLVAMRCLEMRYDCKTRKFENYKNREIVSSKFYSEIVNASREYPNSDNPISTKIDVARSKKAMKQVDHFHEMIKKREIESRGARPAVAYTDCTYFGSDMGYNSNYSEIPQYSTQEVEKSICENIANMKYAKKRVAKKRKIK